LRDGDRQVGQPSRGGDVFLCFRKAPYTGKGAVSVDYALLKGCRFRG